MWFVEEEREMEMVMEMEMEEKGRVEGEVFGGFVLFLQLERETFSSRRRKNRR